MEGITLTLVDELNAIGATLSDVYERVDALETQIRRVEEPRIGSWDEFGKVKFLQSDLTRYLADIRAKLDTIASVELDYMATIEHLDVDRSVLKAQ